MSPSSNFRPMLLKSYSSLYFTLEETLLNVWWFPPLFQTCKDVVEFVIFAPSISNLGQRMLNLSCFTIYFKIGTDDVFFLLSPISNLERILLICYAFNYFSDVKWSCFSLYFKLGTDDIKFVMFSPLFLIFIGFIIKHIVRRCGKIANSPRSQMTKEISTIRHRMAYNN